MSNRLNQNIRKASLLYPTIVRLNCLIEKYISFCQIRNTLCNIYQNFEGSDKFCAKCAPQLIPS